MQILASLVALHFLLLFAIALAAAAAAWWIVRASAHRRLRRFARDLKPRNGETGIVGRVVVTGDGCAPQSALARGRVLAAQSMWLSRRRRDQADAKRTEALRADVVSLATDDGEIELAGPLEATVGSRARWGRKVWVRGAPGHMESELSTAIASGDAVLALGKLTGVGDGPGAYRRAATRKRLEPEAPGGAIRLVYRRPPAPIDARLLLHPLVVVVVFVSLWLPYQAARDYSLEREVSDRACGYFGECHIAPTWRWQTWTKALHGWIHGRHFDNIAGGDDCRRSTECSDHGRCTAVRGRCSATDNQDCGRSWECWEYGHCSAVDGICAVTKDVDCRWSRQCADFRQCTAKGAICVVNDASCRASDDCRNQGDCSAVNGSCAAASRADCQNTWGCLVAGDCTPNQGTCQARNANDCAWSQQCRMEGECLFRDGSCAHTTGDCRGTAPCRLHGECTGKDGFCSADSEHDCRASVGCKTRGECTLIDRRCRKSCAADLDCRIDGLCGELDGHCVATARGCKHALTCLRDGRCTARGGRCVAGSDADCQSSLWCRLLGRCTASKGTCTGGDDGCRFTRKCTDWGRCRHGSLGCEVGTKSDCARSTVCKKNGWCTLIESKGSKLCFTTRP